MLLAQAVASQRLRRQCLSRLPRLIYVQVEYVRDGYGVAKGDTSSGKQEATRHGDILARAGRPAATPSRNLERQEGARHERKGDGCLNNSRYAGVGSVLCADIG